jgi:hypothetical protein
MSRSTRQLLSSFTLLGTYQRDSFNLLHHHYQDKVLAIVDVSNKSAFLSPRGNFHRDVQYPHTFDGHRVASVSTSQYQSASVSISQYQSASFSTSQHPVSIQSASVLETKFVVQMDSSVLLLNSCYDPKRSIFK